MSSTPLKGVEFKSSLTNKSIGEFVFDCIKNYGDRICQINADTGESETYSSVGKRSVRLAIHLQNKHYSSKDVVACCAYNSIDNTIPIIASFLLGAKIVNLDPTLSARTTTYLLKLVNPSIIFVDESSLDLIESALTTTELKTEIVVFGQSATYLQFSDLVVPSTNEAEFKPSKVDVYDTAVMFFSSGTTGFPKVICHSHCSFLQSTEIGHKIHPTYGSIMHFTSFYWISAMWMLTEAFRNGSARVFSQNLHGDAIFRAVEKYKLEVIFLAPFYTYNLTNVRNPDKYDFSSLRLVLTGGTSISTAQFNRLSNLFQSGVVLFSYGMTETGLISGFNPQTDLAFIKSKTGSCGKVAFNTKIKVVNPDTQETVGPYQRGEICVKTSGMMIGYYKMDSAIFFDDEGYFKTGDIGYYDEDGCLYVVARIKEMFKYRSWHIVPSSLEAVLLEHPAVKETVVFGLPRGEEGEIPAACVVLKENFDVDGEEIEKFVEERVSDRERLRGGVTILDSLPRSPSGKLIRHEIRNIIKSI